MEVKIFHTLHNPSPIQNCLLRLRLYEKLPHPRNSEEPRKANVSKYIITVIYLLNINLNVCVIT